MKPFPFTLDPLSRLPMKGQKGGDHKERMKGIPRWMVANYKIKDKVMLYHNRSNMSPGSKSTRYSLPYLVNKVLLCDYYELWHKKSVKLRVHKRRLKQASTPDAFMEGDGDPPPTE